MMFYWIVDLNLLKTLIHTNTKFLKGSVFKKENDD